MKRFDRLIRGYVSHLRAKDYAAGTIRLRERLLREVRQFLLDRGVPDVTEFDQETLVEYIKHLLTTTSPRTGELRSYNYVRSRLQILRMFYGYLNSTNQTLDDPLANIELPPPALRPPEDGLTDAEAARLLAAPTVDTPLGLRDRALLELALATGMRTWELTGLNVADVDLAARRVTIQTGEPRTVEIKASVAGWIDRYLTEARPRQLRSSSEQALFLSNYGARLVKSGLYILLRRWVRRSGLKRRVGWQTLRRTCAARLLREGADAQTVREMSIPKPPPTEE